MKLADMEDMHKTLDEIEFGPEVHVHYGAVCL